MERFISNAAIQAAVDYFKNHDYTRPEQIGLFLYFKAMGFNEYINTEYVRWGQMPTADRGNNTRVLYDLSAVFSEDNETGMKRTSLFPFSIGTSYRGNSFYNGGTPFARLGSRIQDTLDNALVSTFIRRDNTETSAYIFSDDYIPLLHDNYLRGTKIPLDYLAAYYYRFWKIEMPVGSSDQDFTDVCVLGFLRAFHVSCNEFSGLFHYNGRTISSADSHISGESLRRMLGLDRLSPDVAPEISEEPFINVIPLHKTISEEEVRELLDLRGDTLDEETILGILSETDRVLQEQAAALNIRPEDHRDYTRDELMAMDDHEFIFSCLEMMSYHRLFNGYTLPIMESREQCALLFRHHISDPTSELKQVLKVLQRYGSKEQIVTLYHGTDRGTGFNLLAVMLYLLDDFHQYGAYTNDEDIVEKNGEGPILWERTISNGFAIISNNRPYYIDYYTSRTIDDEYDFFHRLHLCVVSSCSKQLQSAGIMELFDMIPVDVSEEKIDDFGETEYILYRIQSELNVQFNTRKQTLLKTLYAFIANARTLETNDGISMYGTPSFNLVWEQVCSEVFQNKLKTQLRHLHLPGGVRPPFRQMDTLLDLIEKPKWAGISNSGTSFVKESNDTLTPDLIGLQEIDGDMAFIILDAKYYCIQLSENAMLRGQPGVGDVTKQYLYQLAYKGFLDAHNITNVKNCFLMPVETDEVEKVGEAYMSMLDNLGLQRIQIRLLPAKKMFDQYLRRRPLGLDILCL